MTWISVDERLPEPDIAVLIVREHQARMVANVPVIPPRNVGVSVGYMTEYSRRWVNLLCLQDDSVVTHWMPLPEPPRNSDELPPGQR